MQYIIYVSKLNRIKAARVAETIKMKKVNKKKKGKSGRKEKSDSHRKRDDSVFFTQAEDSTFEKYAVATFDYACSPKNSQEYMDTNGTAVNSLGVRISRRVFIIPFESLEKIYLEVNELYHL